MKIQIWKSPMTVWQDTVRKNPESASAHINYATVLLLEGDQTGAEKELLIALEQKEVGILNESIAFDSLGLIAFSQERYEDAQALFLKAVEKDPDNEIALNNLGAFYVRMSNVGNKNVNEKKEFLRAAIEYYKKALRRAPNYVTPQQNIAACYFQLREYEEAKKYLHMIIDSDPRGELGIKAAKFITLINKSDRNTRRQ